ncbi:MAG: hypothetical protein IT173_07455 [Acidobacteria bacterium]|nr:hypothetical protein [Acidobacteriota bacterium]
MKLLNNWLGKISLLSMMLVAAIAIGSVNTFGAVHDTKPGKTRSARMAKKADTKTKKAKKAKKAKKPTVKKKRHHAQKHTTVKSSKKS